MSPAERILGWAGDADPDVVRDKVLAFRGILLLHVCVQSWHFFHLQASYTSISRTAQLVIGGVAFVQTCCLGLSFRERWARWVPWLVLPTLVYQVTWYFPSTTNHFYLSVWLVGLYVLLDSRTQSEQRLLLQALQWTGAIVLFYTGFQKLVYGTYFQGDFLAFSVGTSQSFAEIFQLFLPREELARLLAIDPTVHGAGPYRADSLVFVLVSNFVYLAEIGLPIALMHRRTRGVATWITIAFVCAIQAGAREFIFMLLFGNLMLLFSTQAWTRKLFWLLVFLYLYVLGVGLDLLPGSGFAYPATLAGGKHI